MRLPLFLSMILFPISQIALAQQDSSHYRPSKRHTDFSPNKQRFLLWYGPAGRNTSVHGVSLGLYNGVIGRARHFHVNGISAEINPASVLFSMYSLFEIVSSLPHAYSQRVSSRPSNLGLWPTYPEKDTVRTRLRGLNLSPGYIGDVALYGISINLISTYVQENYGIVITGFENTAYKSAGIIISGVHNKATIGHGLHIALFNTVKDGKLVQLGLVNRIGRRVLPVMNLQL